MAVETPGGMRDARDAEDARLLEAGEHEELLATYLDTIVGRCRANVYGPDADDVAQNVLTRLWSELARGRRYTVPYRVVVHKVIDWKLKEHFTGIEHHSELDEVEDRAYEDYEDVLTELDLTALIERLSPRDREVAYLRFVVGLEPGEIAGRLGLDPNPTYQALHRARTRLKEWLG